MALITRIFFIFAHYHNYITVVGDFHCAMYESKGKIKTRDFLDHIQDLGQNSSDRKVDGFQETQNELIKKFATDAEDLVNYNEWGVALGNLLYNIYEIEFTLDKKAIDLAKEAISECKMDYNDWIFMEELVK